MENLRTGYPIYGQIVPETKGVGQYIEAGNTGFRIIILKNTNIWRWHFTPEGVDVPPVPLDMHIRVKYVRMFIFGFTSFLEWLKGQTSNNRLDTPEELSSTTNKTMNDFLTRILGEDKIASDEVENGKFYTRILLPKVLNDKELLQKLNIHREFILKHPFLVYENED